jgi:hypothetical protein
MQTPIQSILESFRIDADPPRYKIAYRPATLLEKIGFWKCGYGWIKEIAYYQQVSMEELAKHREPNPYYYTPDDI